MIDFSRIAGFQWDQGNAGKNLWLHGVEDSEAEQVFLDWQLIILDDIDHSQDEARFNALGVTLRGRFLHVTFTMRNANTIIRVISARVWSQTRRSDMPKKELKPIPYFETEDEERAFWGSHDSTDYVDWSKARRVQFPNLRLTPPEELAEVAESATVVAD